MENKKDIFIALYEGEFSFKEMPQMKVLDFKEPLSVVKEWMPDFDPTKDRGITAVCGEIEKFERDTHIFRLRNVKLVKLDSFGRPIDEKAIECTFYQMNNYI